MYFVAIERKKNYKKKQNKKNYSIFPIITGYLQRNIGKELNIHVSRKSYKNLILNNVVGINSNVLNFDHFS